MVQDPSQILKTYTPFYCEENCFKLLEQLESRSWVIFISSPSRTCLLCEQRAAGETGYVIWDYHVVACWEKDDGVHIIDLDSTLGACVPLADYVAHTFRPDLFASGSIPESLNSRFRVIPSSSFLSRFASDRSHMLVSDSYIKPPPLHPPIQGPLARQLNETHNLWTRFLDMTLSEEELNVDTDKLGIVLPNPSALLSHPWSEH